MPEGCQKHLDHWEREKSAFKAIHFNVYHSTVIPVVPQNVFYKRKKVTVVTEASVFRPHIPIRFIYSYIYLFTSLLIFLCFRKVDLCTNCGLKTAYSLQYHTKPDLNISNLSHHPCFSDSGPYICSASNKLSTRNGRNSISSPTSALPALIKCTPALICFNYKSTAQSFVQDSS